MRNVYTGLEQTKYANRAAVQMFSSECNADMELELQTHQYTARTCRSLKEIKFRVSTFREGDRDFVVIFFQNFENCLWGLLKEYQQGLGKS